MDLGGIGMNHHDWQYLAFLLTAAVLSGCSGRPAATAEGPYGGHTADGYLQNPKARTTQTQWCNGQGTKALQITSCGVVDNASQKQFYRNSATTPDYVGSR